MPFICTALIFLAVFEVRAQRGEWEYFTTLANARSSLEVAKLTDTKVLVMGGQVGTKGTTSCEIIDVAEQRVLSAAPMNVARTQFSSIMMPDGSVYVAGGYSDFAVGGVASIERYDPLLDTWTIVGQLSVGRAQTCIAQINNDEFIVIGGRNGSSTVVSNCDIHNIRTGKTRSGANFPYITSSGKAIRLQNGSVLAFGGRSGGPRSFRSDSIYQYVAQSDLWVGVGIMDKVIFAPEPVMDENGVFWLTGGSIEEGDAKDDFTSLVQRQNDLSFVSAGNLANVRSAHCVSRLGEHLLMVMGGADNFKEPIATCEFIDTRSSEIYEAPRMANARYQFKAVEVVKDGIASVLVIGGIGSGVTLGSIEIMRSPCTGTYLDVLRSPASFTLVGSASWQGSAVVLTSNGSYRHGGIWSKTRFPVSPAFDTRFTFRMSNGDDHGDTDAGSPGGEGVALILQNSTPILGIGDVGPGIGYDRSSHGLVVEFDMHRSCVFEDPELDHISIQYGDASEVRAFHNATYSRSTTTTGVPVFKADGAEYHGRLSYKNGQLSVWIGTSDDWADPVLVTDIDLDSLLGLGAEGYAWCGIVSSTGISSQQHELTAWELGLCDPSITSVDGDRTQPVGQTFRIYPSPSGGAATLQLDRPVVTKGMVRILNMRGEQVFQAEIKTDNLLIPDLELTSGTYVVRVEQDGMIATGMWQIFR